MDAELVDRVRAGLDAFNEGDLDRALDAMGDEPEWDTTNAVPDGTLYRGREAIKAYWLDVTERWIGLRIEADEWVEAGERVVMLGRLVGTGSGSGVPVEGPWNQVWSLASKRALRCDNYVDPDAALAAAGVAAREGKD